MPLEISEIGIRLAVGDGNAQPEPVNEKATGQQLSLQEQEKLVEATVKRVLATLRQEEGR